MIGTDGDLHGPLRLCSRTRHESSRTTRHPGRWLRARWGLPADATGLPGGHGHGVRRAPAAPEPAGGGEDHGARAGGERGGAGALSPRGEGDLAARPPPRGAAARLRHHRLGPALPGDRVPGGRGPGAALARVGGCRCRRPWTSCGRWPRRWPPSTPRGSSTAISSRATCLLLPIEGGADFVKLVDFGISKVRPPDTQLTHAASHGGHARVHVARAGHGAGRRGRPPQRPVGAGGCLLWRMLSRARRRSRASHLNKLLGSILRDEPPPLVALAPRLTPDIEAVLRRALSKRSVRPLSDGAGGSGGRWRTWPSGRAGPSPLLQPIAERHLGLQAAAQRGGRGGNGAASRMVRAAASHRISCGQAPAVRRPTRRPPPSMASNITTVPSTPRRSASAGRRSREAMRVRRFPPRGSGGSAPAAPAATAGAAAGARPRSAPRRPRRR